MRAIRGELDERLESLDEFPKDSDGSAKVALIAYRSLHLLPGEKSAICFPHNVTMTFLIFWYISSSYGGNVEKAFPDARAFIRPGFDKIDLNS